MTITKIKNLSNSAELSEDDLKKFVDTKFSDTITSTKAIEAIDWSAADNIEVTWTQEEGDKVTTRAVGGSWSSDSKKANIKGLVDVSKYSISVNGKLDLEIEVVDPKDSANKIKEKLATLSVRMGNLPTSQNPSNDWRIDLTDKEDGRDGSTIKVEKLIAWMSTKIEPGNLPKDLSSANIPGKDSGNEVEKIKSLEIVIENFNINITEGTFDVNMKSSVDSKLVIGAFTISDVGLRLTNRAIVESSDSSKKLKDEKKTSKETEKEKPNAGKDEKKSVKEKESN